VKEEERKQEWGENKRNGRCAAPSGTESRKGQRAATWEIEREAKHSSQKKSHNDYAPLIYAERTP